MPTDMTTQSMSKQALQAQLLEQILLARHQHFGARSERYSLDQMALAFDEAEAAGACRRPFPARQEKKAQAYRRGSAALDARQLDGESRDAGAAANQPAAR